MTNRDKTNFLLNSDDASVNTCTGAEVRTVRRMTLLIFGDFSFSPISSSYPYLQGTAGIVLDACTHIWDGAKLRPLQRSHRKQLLDFYQRHSMTG